MGCEDCTHIYMHTIMYFKNNDNSCFIDQKSNAIILINQIPEIHGFYFFNSQSY